MNIILLIVALVLIGILIIPATIIQLLFDWKGTDKWLRKVDISLDQFGNVYCARLLNWALITKESWHKFGNEDETVSSVLGKNKAAGTLTWLGWLISIRLNKIEKNHVEQAIENDEKLIK
jgi:hypothetical protein